MLDAIIRLSLRYRMLVIIASLVVLAYGSYLATQMSIDVFPDLDRPRRCCDYRGTRAGD